MLILSLHRDEVIVISSAPKQVRWSTA